MVFGVGSSIGKLDMKYSIGWEQSRFVISCDLIFEMLTNINVFVFVVRVCSVPTVFCFMSFHGLRLFVFNKESYYKKTA